MKQLQLQSGKLEDVLTIIRVESGPLGNAIYRGHRNYHWELVPSLYREHMTHITKGTPNEKTYDGIERKLLRDFFDKAIAFGPFAQSGQIIDRIIAQHYAIPTRLLDWTRDPLVALFFALTGFNEADDAALYFIDVGGGHPAEHQLIPFNKPITKVFPPAIDQRISAQKSIFTIHSFGSKASGFEPLEERDFSVSSQAPGLPHVPWAKSFGKIRIGAKHKYSLVSDLLSMGIDYTALFPGLEGVGTDVAMRHSKSSHVAL